jgi:hypothetical protein
METLHSGPLAVLLPLSLDHPNNDHAALITAAAALAEERLYLYLMGVQWFLFVLTIPPSSVPWPCRQCSGPHPRPHCCRDGS